MNQYIDHTLLKATTTSKDIAMLCQEALQHHFFAVCVNSSYVHFCAEQLKHSAIKVASVVGFPLGASSSVTKWKETEKALNDGATEIDMVINIAWVKEKEQKFFVDEISQIKKMMGNLKLKIILEMCYLTEEEKRLACEWSLEAGCDFLKTSTGFGTGGATLEDVKLMKHIAQDKAEIKASGGIRNLGQAKLFIDAGATRIGTSNGIAIVQGEEAKGKY